MLKENKSKEFLLFMCPPCIVCFAPTSETIVIVRESIWLAPTYMHIRPIIHKYKQFKSQNWKIKILSIEENHHNKKSRSSLSKKIIIFFLFYEEKVSH